MAIGVLGKTNRAGFSDSFEARGDVHAVPHQVAVALLDDIAQMDADPEFYAALWRQASVALDHTALHLDGAADGVDYAAEFDEAAVPSALNHATMMHSNGWVDQIAAQRPESRQNPVLVGPGKPRIADDVRH